MRSVDRARADIRRTRGTTRGPARAATHRRCSVPPTIPAPPTVAAHPTPRRPWSQRRIVPCGAGIDWPRFEGEPTRTLAPPRNPNHAPMIVGLRRGAPYRIRAEAVVADQRIGRLLQRLPVERSPDSPLPPRPERRLRGVVRPDAITVATREGTVPGVELRMHLVRRHDPHVVRQERIERSTQLVRRPRCRHRCANGLTTGVHASVRSTRTDCAGRRVAEPAQRLLDDSLDGAGVRLALPSRELRPVVVEDELNRALRHHREVTKRQGGVKNSCGGTGEGTACYCSTYGRVSPGARRRPPRRHRHAHDALSSIP